VKLTLTPFLSSGQFATIALMGTPLEELEKQARALTPNEKAALAHLLIEQLDASSDADAERLWIELAQLRYDAFVAGELSPVPGDEAMCRARARLK
jgi:hypothetical protein